MSKLASPRLIGATALVLAALALLAAMPGASLAAPGPIALKVTPSPANFAKTLVGQKTPLEIELFNEGEEVSIVKVAIEGPEAGEFSSGGGNCGNLGEGQHCTVTIEFTPNSTGEKHATADIRFFGERGEESFELNGTAVSPHVKLTPSSFDFGAEEINSGSTSTNIQVENDSGAVEQINSVEFSGGNSNGFFFGNDECNGRNMRPGETCSIQVNFGPNDTGPYATQVRVNVGAESFTVDLSGEGVRPEFEITPNPVQFGAATVGSDGSTQTVTVHNTGVVPTGFFIAIVSGGDSGSFRLLDENCTNHELAPASTCTAQVRFSPLSAGPLQATLALFGDNDGPVQLPLLGQGLAPALTMTPASYDFGSQATGAKSAAHSFAVRNEGTTAVQLGTVSIAGADLDQFLLSGDECSGASLGAGQECLVRARFAPDAAGVSTAKLLVGGDTGSLTSSLSGTGTSAAGAATPKVSFHWRGDGKKMRGGAAISAGTASCKVAKRCKVTVTSQLQITRHPRRGLLETQLAKLPKLSLGLATGTSKPIEVRLPAAVQELLGNAHATLLLKAKWTAGGRSGNSSASARVH